MPSNAKRIFDEHMIECRDAVTVYDHLERAASYKADFNLRFAWIATISALDHYISQLILERATFAYSNGLVLQGKLLSDVMTFSSAMELRNSDPIESILVFRSILDGVVRYKSFQSPDGIADGLAYIWPERHKWKFIADKMGIEAGAAKRKLSAIVDRRNVIAHNGDYDEALGRKLTVTKGDAAEVISFISSIVEVIDEAVGPQ